KTKLAKMVNRKAKLICAKLELPGKNINPTKIPNFAASKVPAVVGETNLFKEICCMINPLTLKPTPAKIKAIVLGKRLTLKTKPPLSIMLLKFAQSICLTPINKEAKTKMKKAKISKNVRIQYS